MNKEKPFIQSLDELAFEGRNKAYGSYQLRRKYIKYVLTSLIISIVILLLLTGIPFLDFYFSGSGLKLSDDEMYMVDYTFMPAPEEDLAALAGALASDRPAEKPLLIERA